MEANDSTEDNAVTWLTTHGNFTLISDGPCAGRFALQKSGELLTQGIVLDSTIDGVEPIVIFDRSGFGDMRKEIVKAWVVLSQRVRVREDGKS